MAWPTACKQVSRFGVAVRASPLVRLAPCAYNQSSAGLHRDKVLRSRWCVFDGGFNLKTERRHSTSPSFSLSLCILLCECLRSTCSRLEISTTKVRHLHLRRDGLLRFINLNEPCFLCVKGARLYTITSECGSSFTGPMPWSLSLPTSLNPPQHGSTPGLQWQGGCTSAVVRSRSTSLSAFFWTYGMAHFGVMEIPRYPHPPQTPAAVLRGAAPN